MKISPISQIIVVDDGSTDGCADFIQTSYPNVELINLPHNMGKTQAVKKAIMKVKTSHVLLMDADLKHLKTKEVESGLIHALKHPDVDMLIFIRRKPGNVASVFSGERILKTELLRAALLRFRQAKNFQLEAAINQYCLDTHRRVVYQSINASNTFRIEKRKSLIGFFDNFETISQITKLVGWKNYFRQLMMPQTNQY